MDDYLFRTQQSPRNEVTMNNLVSPPRSGNRLPQPVTTTHDPRTTLPRRFTTDSGRVPTLSTISSQRPPEPQEYPSAAQYKVQLLEKKKLEYERLREQKRRFEAEMQKLDQQQRLEELELAQMQEDLGRENGNGLGMPGHLSEPTTPPEYRETSGGFPTMFSRPNRYSTSSITSPPGLFNRPGRSGSQLASPQSGIMQSQYSYDEQHPYRSVPASRRNSDEDEKEEALRQDPTSHRSTNALNRYSLPVTRRGNLYDNIDQTNAAGFLFRDDESGMDSKFGVESVDPKSFAQKTNPNRLSASGVLDIGSQLGAGEVSSNGWGNVSRHRSQQSMSTLNASESVTSGQSNASVDGSSVGTRQSNFRHSLDPNYFKSDGSDASSGILSPSTTASLASPPKLQTSYSSSDIPTSKAVAGPNALTSNANAHAQQHFHNHNASIGRIPLGALPNRHSRELSADGHIAVTQAGAGFPSIGSALQANAPVFGPTTSAAPASQASSATSPSVTSPSSLGSYPSYYPNNNFNATSPNGNGYVLPLAMSMQNMNLGYSSQNYTGYGPMFQNAQPRDSQQRVIQQRRAQDQEAMSRYANMPLEQVGGTIYELCKDQHGCRYLQKQLENRNPEQVHMIWLETNAHVVELMTDPFGNYLCQKLFEYCNDEERTVLIQHASSDMVRIALNQHGTRALQKMIEFVSTPTHINLIVEALRYEVVPLIQDLNGNHVIQKCLNKLAAKDAQFIFDAVGNHCIEVGTHRHGCCVLQRCIDHASGDQKLWLIARITDHALRLVQDPFGNYVVQYIIDLNEPTFTEPLVHQFGTKICDLSKHKFSSNVIEKCLRCASDQSRDMMVNELLNSGEMEKMLRDSFGNYVVQTALEHATFHMKHQLVEAIRPLLPAIRSTPYGRRLQAKIQAFDNRTSSANTSGQATPADPTQGQIPLRPTSHSRGMSNSSILSSPTYSNGLNGSNRSGINYPTSNILNVPPPQPPRLNQYQTYPGAVQHGSGSEGQFF